MLEPNETIEAVEEIIIEELESVETWSAETPDELWPIIETEKNNEADETLVLLTVNEEPVMLDIFSLETEELVEKIEALPEEKIEEAAAILETVLNTVERVLSNQDIGETDAELVIAGLEVLVERLLTCLEIEHDDKQVTLFVQALLNMETPLDFETFALNKDEGTHEYKATTNWLVAVMSRPLYIQNRRRLLLSRYILRLSFAERTTAYA